MNYTLPEFLAHAIALEQEAADRYLELADMQEAHRNDAVSQVFRDMSRYSVMHRDSIRERVGAVEVPALKSSEYRWRMPAEVGGDEAFDYMMEPYNALCYARANEVRGMKFYRAAAAAASDPELRRLANEFALEERGHVLALDDWIERTARPAGPFFEDPGAFEPV